MINLGTNTNTNGSSATYVLYAFAEVENYSKMGVMEGNANTDGAVVYLGFRPRYVWIKNIDQNGYEFVAIDSERNQTNEMAGYIRINENSAENTSYNQIDFLSNGFKIRSAANNDINHASTAIYYAVAETSVKNSNAR